MEVAPSPEGHTASDVRPLLDDAISPPLVENRRHLHVMTLSVLAIKRATVFTLSSLPMNSSPPLGTQATPDASSSSTLMPLCLARLRSSCRLSGRPATGSLGSGTTTT